MSPLAKSFIDPRSGQTVSARAELFVRGREYVNCYEEENSPFEQRRKMEEQILLRRGGRNDQPLGEDKTLAFDSSNNNNKSNATPTSTASSSLSSEPAPWSSPRTTTDRNRSPVSSLSKSTSLNKAILDEENYLEALEWALPPTGGWGVGIDRLVMLFSGQHRIANVLPFGTLRNVVGLHHLSHVQAQARAQGGLGSGSEPGLRKKERRRVERKDKVEEKMTEKMTERGDGDGKA